MKRKKVRVESDAGHAWLWRRLTLLEGLTDWQRRTLSDASEVLELKRGAVLYRPGDPAEHVHLLGMGVVRLLASEPDGMESTLAFVCPGEMFGESALITATPRDHTAQVQRDAIVLAVPRETLLALMQQAPALSYRAARVMARQVHALRARVQGLGYRRADARLAHLLLLVARQVGSEVRDGILIPFPLSQSEMAELVGSRRETVNSALQRFRRRGLVSTDRHSIRLRDPDKLAAIVD